MCPGRNRYPSSGPPIVRAVVLEGANEVPVVSVYPLELRAVRSSNLAAQATFSVFKEVRAAGPGSARQSFIPCSHFAWHLHKL